MDGLSGTGEPGTDHTVRAVAVVEAADVPEPEVARALRDIRRRRFEDSEEERSTLKAADRLARELRFSGGERAALIDRLHYEWIYPPLVDSVLDSLTLHRISASFALEVFFRLSSPPAAHHADPQWDELCSIFKQLGRFEQDEPGTCCRSRASHPAAHSPVTRTSNLWELFSDLPGPRPVIGLPADADPGILRCRQVWAFCRDSVKVAASRARKRWSLVLLALSMSAAYAYAFNLTSLAAGQRLPPPFSSLVAMGDPVEWWAVLAVLVSGVYAVIFYLGTIATLKRTRLTELVTPIVFFSIMLLVLTLTAVYAAFQRDPNENWFMAHMVAVLLILGVFWWIDSRLARQNYSFCETREYVQAVLYVDAPLFFAQLALVVYAWFARSFPAFQGDKFEHVRDLLCGAVAAQMFASCIVFAIMKSRIFPRYLDRAASNVRFP